MTNVRFEILLLKTDSACVCLLLIFTLLVRRSCTNVRRGFPTARENFIRIELRIDANGSFFLLHDFLVSVPLLMDLLR